MDASLFKRPFEPESNYDTESDSDNEDRRLLERFLHKRKKRRSRKKRTNSLVMEAQQLICEINERERTKKKTERRKDWHRRYNPKKRTA